jgi:hypothetical protein
MVLVEVEPVLVLLLLFLPRWLFFVLFIVLVSVPVLLVDVFCARTTVPDSMERPRAAIMIFFI